MAAPPRLQLHIGDYLKNTPAISRATWEHHGIYLLALIIAWNVPGVRLPQDIHWLALRFGCTHDEVEQHVLPVIRTYFKSRGNFWYQKRLTEEHKFVSNYSERQSARAKSRWEKEKDTSHGSATAVPRHPSGICLPTPTPIPKEKEERTSSFVVGRLGRKEGALNGSNGADRVTVTDPNKRIGRFMNKIATHLGGEPGWALVIAAADASAAGHHEAVATCRRAAREIGKGWPRNWPTDGKFFTSTVDKSP